MAFRQPGEASLKIIDRLARRAVALHGRLIDHRRSAAASVKPAKQKVPHRSGRRLAGDGFCRRAVQQPPGFNIERRLQELGTDSLTRGQSDDEEYEKDFSQTHKQRSCSGCGIPVYLSLIHWSLGKPMKKNRKAWIPDQVRDDDGRMRQRPLNHASFLTLCRTPNKNKTGTI